MKKIIFTAILGLFLGLATMSVAQTSSNYKQQFSAKRGKAETTVIYSLSTNSYQAAHNYKQVGSLKDVVLISNKSATLPFCCTTAKISSDYKHPFSKNEKQTCKIGYVCKETVKEVCCN